MTARIHVCVLCCLVAAGAARAADGEVGKPAALAVPATAGDAAAAAPRPTAPELKPIVVKPVTPALGVNAMCGLIEKASRGHGLPPSFFTRLIWQESRFRSDALSPAGAQGIAQFMPGTASGRGLADPFSTPDALEQSAAYLQELRQTFGNLGLAAAAYNAGPGRLTRFLAGEIELPAETLAYVEIVTGHAVAEWRQASVPEIGDEAGFSCARIATLASRRGAAAAGDARAPAVSAARKKDWAVILLGNPQRDKLMAEYQIVRGQFSKLLGGVQPSVVHRRIGGLQVARYIVQIEKDRREDANALCSSLLRAGGNCFVLSNR